jgi:hypothetical protein
MKAESSPSCPNTEYKVVSDKDIRPSRCVACGGSKIIRRGHQFHDMQDLGTPTIKRVLRHEKITWECKQCHALFMIVHPDVPAETPFTDDVRRYVFKRVLDKGDAANRVAADLRDLHNVEVTPQAIGEWVKREREKSDRAPGGSNSADGRRPPAAITLDGTFKAAGTKKNGGGPGTSGEQSWLHLTRSRDGRLVAYWLLGKASER